MYDDTVLVDKAYYNKLKEQTTWISVKDRLPPRNGNYLVVTEGLGFFRGCTDIKILYFYNGCFKLDDKDVYYMNITHWMPLPEPPKE